MTRIPRRLTTLAVTTLVAMSLATLTPASAQSDQTILGPGIYVFQTRTRSATCADDERNGYVSSFVAAIQGVPGSRTMRMQLLNSPYWPTWSLQVTAQDRVVGDATLEGGSGPSAPRNHFEVGVDRDRFTGTGTRTYNRGGQMCSVSYDALLRRLDTL